MDLPIIIGMPCKQASFFTVIISNVHRRPSALLKICLFHYDTSNWQFYENAGLVFFAKNIEKSL